MSKQKYFIQKYNNINHVFELKSLPNCEVSHNYKNDTVVAVLPIRFDNGKARYTLQINIDKNGLYSVYIIKPKLKKICGDNPPHIYLYKSIWNQANQEFDECCLCLHLPNSGEYKKKAH